MHTELYSEFNYDRFVCTLSLQSMSACTQIILEVVSNNHVFIAYNFALDLLNDPIRTTYWIM